ncbi:MAG: ribosome silencing factor [Bacteroidales bacterium]|jgi:ribosome-associated protein|nr:ribosome silencing factor [Bacteroidales bacterium]
MRQKSEELSNILTFFSNNIINALQDKKAQDIVELNLSELKLSLFDRFIICTATSTTHAEALCDNVLQTIKQNMNILPQHVEGKQNSQWILIDYFDIMVHIFLKESRAFYDVENLWIDAERTEYDFTKA